MIPQSFIQELLARIDIVDVIEGSVQLKRGGANYLARCPFHNEKSPSFTVSPAKQFYHCFGCGAHGTAISFLMEYHGMGFIDAVKDLAARAGMTVPEPARRDPAAHEATEDLTGALDRAARFFRGQLKRSARAIDYLKGRGLTGEIAGRYGLGYAPEGWQSLEAEFNDYPQNKALLSAGLVIDSPEGRRYDRFRDRIMFPIVGQRGSVIGFGGRVIGEGEPKYLNSPETPVFEKGRELYGLYQARRAIREADRILVVEGYMDVVALAQFGIEYAVATLGTATTPWQIQKLLRQTDTVVFAFDGDEAGRRAAWRAMENSLAQFVDGKAIRFLFLPEGDDPDSFIRQQGAEAFERAVAKAQPLSEFLIRELARRIDLESAEGKARFLQEAKGLVKQVTAPMFSLVLRKEVAGVVGISVAELNDRYQIKGSAKAASAKPVPREGPRVLRKLLGLLWMRPDAASLIEPTEAHRLGSFAGRVSSGHEWEFLLALLDLGRLPVVPRNIAEHFRGSPFEDISQQVEADCLRWELLDDQGFDAEFMGAWRRLLGQLEAGRYEALLRKAALTAEEKAELLRLQRRQVELKNLDGALIAGGAQADPV